MLMAAERSGFRVLSSIPAHFTDSFTFRRGKKIPAKKLAKAAHSENPTLAKRARLAQTLKKMHD